MKLKEYRILVGLTQEKMAEEVGCVVSHINMIELGKRNPSPLLARKISEFTGGAVSVESLIFDNRGA